MLRRGERTKVCASDSRDEVVRTCVVCARVRRLVRGWWWEKRAKVLGERTKCSTVRRGCEVLCNEGARGLLLLLCWRTRAVRGCATSDAGCGSSAVRRGWCVGAGSRLPVIFAGKFSVAHAISSFSLLSPVGVLNLKRFKKISDQIRGRNMTKKGQEKSIETNADFLPLEGGPARKLPKGDVSHDKATVLYVGRIPHGFYEDEMEGFFQQFGTIKRLKIARNRKTGKAKHYGFIEFEYPEVAKIVADCMHNYLLLEHMLQVQLIPAERVHPKLWKGVNRRQKVPVDFVQIERLKHNKDRSLEEQRKMLKSILKRDKKRRSKIQAAGIDYECPEIEGANQPVPKKIRFDDS